MKVSKDKLLGAIRSAIRDEQVSKKVEKKEKEKKTKGAPRRDSQSTPMEQNIHHSADGTFSSKEDSECESTYFTTGNRKSKRKSLSDVPNTGRGKHKSRGKGQYRCRDNKKLWNEEELEELIKDAVREVLAEQKEMTSEDKERNQRFQVACRRAGYRSLGETLKIINAIERANDGKLYGEK